jgi:hypothetical protein
MVEFKDRHILRRHLEMALGTLPPLQFCRIPPLAPLAEILCPVARLAIQTALCFIKRRLVYCVASLAYFHLYIDKEK